MRTNSFVPMWNGVLVASMFMSGCSVLRDPNEVVVVGGERNRILITQADRRAIFTYEDRSGLACPEPSPDVKADVEAAVRALVDTTIKSADSLSAAAKSELEATRKMVTAALLQRSQGLQVLRDMLFQACLANLRGDMAPVQYHQFVTVTLPKLTTSLIAAEMVTRQDGDKPVLKGDDLKAFLNFLILNQ